MSDDEFNFEVFTRPGRSGPRGHVFVTLRSDGNFGVSSAAVELLGNPEAVMLLYSEQKRAIAFQPCSASVLHAYRLRDIGPGSTIVSGRLFCTQFGISYGETRRLPAALVDGLLVAQLEGD